jgi:hypothetical protein
MKLPKPFWLPIISSVLVVLTSPAQAQTGNVERARLISSQAQSLPTTPGVSATPEGVDQNYAVVSPNDTDLGEQAILKRVEKYNPFIFEAGVPIYYTSNVALVDRNRMGDTIIAPVVGITYAPRFQNTLYGEFTLRQQFFYYQDFTSLNFASFDAVAGVAYYMPAFHNMALRANIDWNRLTPTDSLEDFFTNVGLGLNAEIPFVIGRAQQFSVGLDANISLYATPSEPQRNDLGAYVGYSVGLTRNFYLNASGHIVARPYDSGGRTDVSEIVNLGATYRVRNWLTISALTSFVANQSNQDVFEYEVFNVGGGISVSWRF